MERIDIENARIRVEFLKNETNEVVKSEWFDREFVEEMFDVEYPNFPKNLRYYIDFGLYERDLMCDYFEIDGHIFR